MKSNRTLLTAILAIGLSTTASAEGNRYNLERHYNSEISVTEAYLAMQRRSDFKRSRHAPKPVLIDVRSLREYASGHPEGAYNVPYPNVWTSQDQDAATLYWAVYEIVKGNLDTPIMTLCRTGHRSVLAGNILANPDTNEQTKGLPAFTNVRNIWEGFVGQYKYAYSGGTILLDDQGQPYVLSLNDDEEISADTADVYVETTDANPDKDGWRNFAALPWTTHVQRRLAYERNPRHYSDLNLTPVP